MLERAVITTSWDDGHPLDLRIAELLARHGLAGTFYAPRRWRLPTMDVAQLRQLSDAGFELGGHTIDHVVLSETPDAEASQQVRDCRAWLSDATGRACTMFCPPRGRYRSRHLRMIAEAGYAGYRTVELWSTDLPRTRAGRLLELPTSIQAQPHGKLPVLRNLIKRRAGTNLVGYFRSGLTGDWLDHLERLAESTIRRRGVLHLWGHAWEVEAFGQWEQLDRGLALLGSLLDRAQALTNGDLCRAAAVDRQHS